MKDIFQVINILEQEIDDYNFTKEELEIISTKSDLYKEILSYTNNIETIIENKEIIFIILDTVDKDVANVLSKNLILLEIYQKKNIVDTSEYEKVLKNIKKIILDLTKRSSTLETRKKELLLKKTKNKEHIKKFKNILAKIKYKQYISISLVKYLEEFFVEKSYPEIEQIKLLEIINIYNRYIYERVHRLPFTYKNDVLDMLSFGFEVIEDNDIDYNSEIAKKVEFYFEQLKYQLSLKEYLTELKNIIDNENDLKLFYILMIKKIQEEILEKINFIKSKEFYADLEIKKEIIRDYQSLIKFYAFFREEYFKLKDKDDQKVEINDIKVIFAVDKNGKSYFLKDFKKINYEYLDRLFELLTALLKNTLTNRQIEGFTSQYKEFRKLKDDQIRIVIKQIEPKLYCILGCGIKKSNDGRVLYNLLCSRDYPKNKNEINDLLEKSDSVLEEITKFVNENRRKGNR